MWFYISLDNILNGTPLECEWCAVARAMEEQTGLPTRVYGDKMHVGEIEVELPPSVVKFIADYDDGKPVYPMWFRLDTRLPVRSAAS